MNGPQALARIRKLIGKRAEIHDYKKPSSPEQRAAERAAKLAAIDARKRAEDAMTARKNLILDADAEYCALRDAFAEAQRRDNNTGHGHYRRYSCGTNESIFFSVKAEGDTLAELVEACEAKCVKVTP